MVAIALSFTAELQRRKCREADMAVGLRVSEGVLLGKDGISSKD